MRSDLGFEAVAACEGGKEGTIYIFISGSRKARLSLAVKEMDPKVMHSKNFELAFGSSSATTITLDA